MSMKRTAATTAVKRVPAPRPTEAMMDEAFKALSAYQLHFYQVLYFAGLSEPKGHPFKIEWSREHLACLQVLVQPWSGRRQEFDFLITPEMTDEQLLERCKLILDIIQSGKQKVHDMACCAAAEFRPCVCAYSFTCKIHGERCIGTHD